MNISFIIPIYNTNINDIKRCISSIKKMPEDISYEIILVDDGSNKEFSDEYKSLCCNNVKYYYKENGGVSSARNFGIVKSSGKYISFVDSDDEIETSNIDVGLFNNNYDLVLFDMIIISNKGKIYVNELDNDVGLVNLAKLNLEVALRNKLHSPCSKLYRKDFLLKHNVEFKKEMIQGEDAMFNIDFLKHKPKCFYVNKNMYYYYFQISNTNNRWKKFTNTMFENFTYLFNEKKKLVDLYAEKVDIQSYLFILKQNYINDLFSIRLNNYNVINVRKMSKKLISSISINGVDVFIFIKYLLLKLDFNLIFIILNKLRKIMRVIFGEH